MNSQSPQLQAYGYEHDRRKYELDRFPYICSWHPHKILIEKKNLKALDIINTVEKK